MTTPIETLHDEIVEWTTASPRDLGYGHLQTSRGYGASWRLLTGIDATISTSDSIVIFVGNNNEKTMYEYEHSVCRDNPKSERVNHETYEPIPEL
jgi:hypothetical protein